MRNFKAKLACVNCGMDEFYRLPFRADIKGYKWYDGDEERLSHYVHNEQEYDLNCMNCGLPYLTGNNFWEPSNQYGLRESDGRGEASRVT